MIRCCRQPASQFCLAFAFVALAGSDQCGAEEAPPVDFTRDVRPILAENCFHCHGPDEEQRQAELRLDVWEATGDVLGAEAVIVSGKPDESEFVARITSEDGDLRMPPADSGKVLRPQQIEALREWVAQGAPHEPHWAFVAPRRPAVPDVKQRGWVRNPIDAFVLARLEQEGLAPSPVAAPHTLLRRLSLDLIGLPPTLDEVAAFEADSSEGAYERQVERLLASPHFGERWARLWLDVARYADSDGFEKDKPRSVWMYRDWVIGALNADMPYDEFLVAQIAGDLLPGTGRVGTAHQNSSQVGGSYRGHSDRALIQVDTAHPTQDDLVATGFLRNSMVNEEGGIDPEQFRMEAMFDRMDAIGKGILGLTVQCAQCHNHKYDPLSQVEYYRMFAFLNNCHEAQVSVYSPEEHEQWASTLSLIRRVEDRIRENNPDWRERMAQWEQAVRRQRQPVWTVVQLRLDDESGQKYYMQEDGSVLAAGYAPTKPVARFVADGKLPKITAMRLELLNDPNLPRGGPGRSIYGTCALTEFIVEAAPLAQPERRERLKFASATADVNPPVRKLAGPFAHRKHPHHVTGPIGYANDGNDTTAWSIEIGPGRSNVPRKAVFVLDRPLEMPAGAHLRIDLSQQHGGLNSDDNQNNNLGRFRISVTSAEKPVADPLPAAVREILAIPPPERTVEQTEHVFSYWRTTVAEWAEENRQIEALWQSHPRGTTQLALLERDQRRATHLLERGNFLAPADEVSPGVPEFLHPLDPPTGDASSSPDSSLGETRPRGAPNRLAFGRWLADRRSPTTARAMVNRIWQAYFGTGLVATAEDLGTQGEPPSHPELLDWLAVELMDNDWSVKHIHRLIVRSATYRQSSTVAPELLNRDPDNRLLARGSRFRVDAEAVRDIALTASGLLNNKIGGPSVHPPAPAFLFKPPASYGPKTWIVDTGPNRYRRALYTFRFRSVPYPMLQNFDAPNGEFACARRVRSNTPLQALTTLNEPLFVECARALAVRVVAEAGATDAERVALAVRCCLAREPDEEEATILQEFLQRQKKRWKRKGADPWLLLADEEQDKRKMSSKLPAGADPAELAAWTAVARIVLNLDETITKE